MNIFILIPSLSLLIVSIFLYRKNTPPLIIRLFFSLLFFISVILYLFYGIADYFTGNGINDAVIYHLNYGLQGAGFLEYRQLIITVYLIVLASLIFAYFMFLREHRNNRNNIVNLFLAFFFIILSLFFSPASHDLYNVFSQKYSNVDVEFSDIAGIENLDSIDFNNYYKNPYLEKIGENKNLVFIYAEGLEQTYSNEDIFPNLTRGLNNLQLESTYFTNIKQIEGAEYTIAGVVSSQCGIPLFSPSHGNSMFGMDEFLPSANCLGDLLSQEGYYLSYYGGANLDFAGKGKFYNTHKFNEINGFVELSGGLQEKTYKNGWGLYDDSLFDMSYQRFIELSKNKDKFALFLLTLDTHHPNGQISESCKGLDYGNGSNPMLNAVACSDYLITKFVDQIRQSPYAEETVIVIVSDHLAMRNTASEILKKSERRNRFMIIDSANSSLVKIDNLGSALDIGTTILPFIGYKGIIGLGRDLIDDSQEETEIEYIHKMLISWKPSYLQFFDFPRLEDSITINVENETIKIDDRIFKIPILVEFNSKLETSLKFQFNLSDQRSLIEEFKKINPNNSFLLIDYCEDVKKIDDILLDNASVETKFCFVSGRDEKYYAMPIKNNLFLTLEDIKLFINLSQ